MDTTYASTGGFPAGINTNKAIGILRNLFWVFMFLLIFDGAFRKWGPLKYANYILLLKDLVVLAMYIVSIRYRLFPIESPFVQVTFILGIASTFMAIFALHDNILVTFYGLRSYYFYLPLIFLIPKILDEDDIKKTGNALLLLSIFMTILMVVQFSLPRNHFINKTVEPDLLNIYSVPWKVRPSGTFAFITGITEFFSVTTPFLLLGMFKRRYLRTVLLFPAFLALLLAASIAGSRMLVIWICMIFSLMLIVLIFFPSHLLRNIIKTSFIIIASVFLLSDSPLVKEGIQVFRIRAARAARLDTIQKHGMLSRYLDVVDDMYQDNTEIPEAGLGIGTGGTVGGYFLYQEKKMRYEGEWLRVVSESGILLGSLFILLRFSIILYLAGRSLRSLLDGNFLPFLLMGSCGILLFLGQFEQATTLGFTALSSGLCLASSYITFKEEP